SEGGETRGGGRGGRGRTRHHPVVEGAQPSPGRVVEGLLRDGTADHTLSGRKAGGGILGPTLTFRAPPASYPHGEPGLAGAALPGPALRAPIIPPQPRIRRRRRAHAGPGDRRGHGDVQ